MLSLPYFFRRSAALRRAEIFKEGLRVGAADGFHEEVGMGRRVFGSGVSPGDGGVRVVRKTVAILTDR